MRVDAATTVSTSVLANTNWPPVHSARSRKSAAPDGTDRSEASIIRRWSNEGTVATTYTGTSIELAKPDTSRADSVLLVSMPSVSTMIALCEADRAASRRAVAAVASYSDVVPKGSKSDNAP